jgi:predicted HicB family RNase H-like nuclease
MKYNGYTGTIEPDEDLGILFGRVIGLRDVITFAGNTVPELIQAFHDSVDDYLAFCVERGESPEKPYSGQFVLRVDPQLHRELANRAQEQSVSLNALIERLLEKNVASDVPASKAERTAAKVTGKVPDRPKPSPEPESMPRKRRIIRNADRDKFGL